MDDGNPCAKIVMGHEVSKVAKATHRPIGPSLSTTPDHHTAEP